MAFKDNLKREMDARGVTHEDLAGLLGVSRPAVSQWLSGDTQPVGKRLSKIAAALSTTVKSLFDGVEDSLNVVQVVGYVGGGEQVFAFEEDGLSGSLEYVPMPPGGDEGLVAAIVRGSSMVPAFWDGDVLYYTRLAGFDRSECLYKECVVKLVDGRMFVKHVMPGGSPTSYTLMSFNAAPILDVDIEWAAPVQFHDMRRRNPRTEMKALARPRRRKAVA